MADTNVNIILQLIDKASDGFKKVSSSLQQTSQDLKSFGKDVSQIGQGLTMTGGIITGAFALAIKDASKNIAEVNQVTTEIQNTLNQFQEKIAVAVVPIVQKFSDILKNLLSAFNSLSPGMQNAILQGTFMAGVFLTLGGGIMTVSGKIMSLVGSIGVLTSKFIAFAALNLPLMIILGVIVAIGAAMWQWKPVADTIMSTFEVLFLLLKNGFLAIKAGIEQMLFSMMQGVQLMVDTLAKIPGPTQNAFQLLSNEISIVSNQIRGSLNEDLKGIGTNAETIGQIIQTGQGKWSQAFDKLKVSVSAAGKEIKDMFQKSDVIIKTSSELWNKQLGGMRDALGQLGAALTAAGETNKGMAIAAKAVNIALAIMNTAVGVTNALAIPPPWFGMTLAAMVAAAGAIQVGIISGVKFATGTDTVPAMLSPGEMVFPRSMAEAIRAGAITVGGPGMANGVASNFYIDINIDRPTVSKESDLDYMAEVISRKLSAEVERIR